MKTNGKKKWAEWMEKKPEQKFSMTTEAKFCLWESVRKKKIWYRKICIMATKLMLSPADYAVSMYSVGLTWTVVWCWCFLLHLQHHTTHITNIEPWLILNCCCLHLAAEIWPLILCSMPSIDSPASVASYYTHFLRSNRFAGNYIAVRLGRNQRLRRGQKLDRETWICIIEYTVE